MSDEFSKKEFDELAKKIEHKLKNVTSDAEIVGDNFNSADDNDTPAKIREEKNAASLLFNFEKKWEVNRNERIKRYEQYDKTGRDGTAAGILNIYADEITTEDSDGNIFKVIHSNKRIQETVEDCFDRIGLNDKAWEIARNICHYGDDFWENVVSKNGKRILKLSFIDRKEIERVEVDNILLGFNEVRLKSKEDNYISSLSNAKKINDYKKTDWKAFQINHFRMSNSQFAPYGTSLLDPIVYTIEKLKLLTSSIVVARTSRAPERRIWHIDTGNITGDKAAQAAKRAFSYLKDRKVINNGELDSVKNILGINEDYIMPKARGSEGNSVETLPQIAATGVEDIELVRDEVFPPVGVPRQYLFDDQFANANTNLSSKSIPFAKRIKRYQREILKVAYKIAIIELKLQGFSNEEIEELTILMNNPSNIDEKEKIEIETSRWGLISTIKGVNGDKVFVPDYIIYKDILKLSDEEIVLWMKLAQLQQNEKNIFNAFNMEERPDGSEDLSDGESEEQEDLGGEEDDNGNNIPDDVEKELGPPPKEENESEEKPEEEIENADTIKIEKTNSSIINEDEKRKIDELKSRIINIYNEQLINEQKELDESNINKDMTNSYCMLEEYLFSGELLGIKDFIKKTKNNKESSYLE